jgi:hypothetical protein
MIFHPTFPVEERFAKQLENGENFSWMFEDLRINEHCSVCKEYCFVSNSLTFDNAIKCKNGHICFHSVPYAYKYRRLKE